ncbi:WD40-repeat-containing domain protein [Epithele typhae]|uniref:WD40-repeat-containing domain protein n=1 Tax=Epithele typhae TaxID=378194 RepID=UPI0020077D2C|nr:WD40-repeat-containing domain protein [Epithele typhae]KAH9910906.1 WD40-repeat-containing domain protein [Epithele typhae]
MSLQYIKAANLSLERKSNTTAVAFSPRGTFLASVDLNGEICVWCMEDYSLVHRISQNGNIPILSVAWMPPDEDSFVCGLGDGTIVYCSITNTELVVSGVLAHSFPVDCLAVASSTRFASGARCDIHVWKRMAQGIGSSPWIEEARIPAPSVARSSQEDLVVTSLHWLAPDQSQLLVTFMNHGIHFIDAVTWAYIRSINVAGQIAHASLASNRRLLAVSNMINGFDVYPLDSKGPVRSFSHPVAPNALRAVHVRFIHGNNALLGGNAMGNVHLWDVDTSEKLARLTLGGMCLILQHCSTLTRSLSDHDMVIAVDVRVSTLPAFVARRLAILRRSTTALETRSTSRQALLMVRRRQK